MSYPADPPRVEEIVAVMCQAGEGIHGDRARGLITVLWRAGVADRRGARPARGRPRARSRGLYLNGPAGLDRFRKGLEWAATPLYAHIALVQGHDPYEPYDYIASYEQRPVPDAMWTAVIDYHATAWEQHVIGISADRFGLAELTERAFRRGDELGDAGGAANLAVLLRKRGDVEAAEAAEARANEHAVKAFRRRRERSSAWISP